MSETIEVAEAAAGEATIQSVHHEAESHADDAILPDAALHLEEAEWRALVSDFRRVRDARRGRYAADVRELPADPIRIATALGNAAEAEEPEHRRALLEDLVDLQAFVPDPPVVVAPPVPGGASDPVSDELLDRIRWRQAVVTAVLLGHASILGDHLAIRERWTPIGDARAAIDLVNDYREKQAVAIGSTAIYPISALVGFIGASLVGLGRPSIVGVLALGIGWPLAVRVGGAAGSFEAWLIRQTWRATRRASFLSLAAGLGSILVLPAVWGVLVAIAGARLALP